MSTDKNNLLHATVNRIATKVDVIADTLGQQAEALDVLSRAVKSIDRRMEGMEPTHTAIARFCNQLAGRRNSTDRRLRDLEARVARLESH